MCKFSKIIISLILVLSMNLSISVFADDYTSSNYNLVDIYTSRLATLGDGVTGGVLENFLGLAINRVSSESSAAFGDGSVCADSPDNLHHSSNYQPSLGGGSDARGYYTFFQCDYCGAMFKCYSDDFSNAYNDHVASMPADNWSSAGTIKVTGEHDYCYVCYTNNSSVRFYCPHYTGSNTSTVFSDLTYSHHCDGSVSIYPSSGSSFFSYYTAYSFYIINCSVSGTYKQLASPSCYITRFNSSSYSSAVTSSVVSKNWSTTSGTYYSAGSSFTASVYFDSGQRCTAAYGDFYAPIYEVTPAAGTTTTNYYVNASRPTYNITYNLATVTQAGDYTVINNVYENQTIINEGDNIYTDIKTGNEYEIEGWEFDYTSRTYHLTLDNGDLVDVTFGDKYVTVELNGEVEYYYYATEDESGDEVTGGDDECTHEFVLADSLEPTCTTGGYDVYACKLCGATREETYFATGHDYQFLWTVLDTYEVDTSTLVCPGCNGTDITCTQVDKTENFTCVCNSADCAQTWTVVGSTIAGYDLYQCINCQEFYNDYTHEGVDRSDAGYWSWLQTWLQNFKTWLGEKLDALASGSGSGSSAGDGKDVSVDLGDTDKENEFKNFFTGFTTFIGLDDVVLDFDVNYTDEDGTEQNTSLKGIIGKFAFIKDIWKIGTTMIAVVSEDAANAYEFDPTIGNEAGLDTGTDAGGEAAAAAVYSIADEDSLVVASDGDSGAPSIPLNLGAAQSHYGYNYGGEIEILDLSWYTPYKETVDKLVGGFLWLFFMWKLFMKAPGIISGASMDASKAEDVKSGTKGRRK